MRYYAGRSAGLGRLSDLETPGPAVDAAVAMLRMLLTDPAARWALAARRWAAVDDRGAERVADALLRHRTPSRSVPRLNNT
jgi:hypothetical protein